MTGSPTRITVEIQPTGAGAGGSPRSPGAAPCHRQQVRRRHRLPRPCRGGDRRSRDGEAILYRRRADLRIPLAATTPEPGSHWTGARQPCAEAHPIGRRSFSAPASSRSRRRLSPGLRSSGHDAVARRRYRIASPSPGSARCRLGMAEEDGARRTAVDGMAQRWRRGDPPAPCAGG